MPAPPPDLLKRVRRRRELQKNNTLTGSCAATVSCLARRSRWWRVCAPEDAELAQDILEACMPQTGASVRVGITGVPGVGKSSVIEALGTYLTRDRGEKVAVLAVDPSSQLSGGSILGDKTRMERLAATIARSSALRHRAGHLGGVARRPAKPCCCAKPPGIANVMVETVGVGQSETAVRSMVDFFLLLMLPEPATSLQGMKRGIMEMTDLVAINKADGDNRDRAELARREYQKRVAPVRAVSLGLVCPRS